MPNSQNRKYPNKMPSQNRKYPNKMPNSQIENIQTKCLIVRIENIQTKCLIRIENIQTKCLIVSQRPSHGDNHVELKQMIIQHKFHNSSIISTITSP